MTQAFNVLSGESVAFAGVPINFGSVNVCPVGQTSSVPCGQTAALSYNVAASGMLGTPTVVTEGGEPGFYAGKREYVYG